MDSFLALGTSLLGLFMVVPLFFLGRTRPANRWLAWFLLSISMLSMGFEVLNNAPVLFGLCDWPVSCVGAFYYCYVRSLLGLGNGRRQVLHFVPLAIFVIALAWARIALPLPTLLHWLFGGEGGGAFGALLLGFQILTIGYAVAALLRLRQYRGRLRERYSSTGDRDLAWLTWLTLVIILLLMVWIPATVLGGIWGSALVMGRLAVLYFVGWYGMRQSAVFLQPLAPWVGPTAHVDASAPDAPAQELAAVPTGDIADLGTSATDKYVRSGMTDAAQQLIGARLQHRMERHKDYLQCELTLSELADRIGTSPQLLSQYINHFLGLNFFDYINGLRVTEVQRMMKFDDPAQQTLLEMAFAAGFNSKSTFNASFKKACGSTPSNWRLLHATTSEPVG
jgi:AraC-like DNA-binding protein